MTHEVLIAGGGPVGLFLACELALGGRSTLVLEQAEQPGSSLKGPPFGLRGLSAPSLDAFHRRGLLEAIEGLTGSSPLIRAFADAARAAEGAPPRQMAGHFAGIQFFRELIDESRWAYRLPGPAGARTAVYMDGLEALLAARAEALGVEIRRGAGVTGVEPSTDGVTVEAGGERLCGRWLVGCDGGRSLVRRAAGFEFAGTEPEFTGYSVEVELADPGALQPGRHLSAAGMYAYAPPGTIAMADFDGGAFHRSASITREHVQAVLRRVSGTDATVAELKLAATWTDRAYQATAYRRGRVLLAGDAAHIHSPLGGQGLNLGLGDAMNLGWKLAAVLRGTVPEGLLDSYERERRPVGAAVLDWSRAQVAVMRPSPSSRALEAIFRDLMETRDGATYFAERVTGVSLRYDLGGGHPLVGRSAPDFEMADGRRLGEHLRSGEGLWLDFAPGVPLQPLAAAWAGRIGYVAAAVRERLGLAALLVRPDGVVAWASDDAADLDAAAAAAARWFGSPTAHRFRPAPAKADGQA